MGGAQSDRKTLHCKDRKLTETIRTEVRKQSHREYGNSVCAPNE